MIYILPKIRDGAPVINFDEYKSVGTHWIALYVNGDHAIYFNSFGVEHIPKENKKFVGKKNIKKNIYRIKRNDLIIRAYFCIRFINFMLKGKRLLDHTYLFFPKEYGKNDKVILKYFNY